MEPDRPPTLAVQIDDGGATRAEGDEVRLSAVATDADGADLSGSVEWWTSRDGPVGLGSQVDVIAELGVTTVRASVGTAGNQAEAIVEIVGTRGSVVADTDGFVVHGIGLPSGLVVERNTALETPDTSQVVRLSAVEPLGGRVFVSFRDTIRDDGRVPLPVRFDPDADEWVSDGVLIDESTIALTSFSSHTILRVEPSTLRSAADQAPWPTDAIKGAYVMVGSQYAGTGTAGLGAFFRAREYNRVYLLRHGLALPGDVLPGQPRCPGVPTTVMGVACLVHQTPLDDALRYIGLDPGRDLDDIQLELYFSMTHREAAAIRSALLSHHGRTELPEEFDVLVAMLEDAFEDVPGAWLSAALAGSSLSPDQVIVHLNLEDDHSSPNVELDEALTVAMTGLFLEQDVGGVSTSALGEWTRYTELADAGIDYVAFQAYNRGSDIASEATFHGRVDTVITNIRRADLEPVITMPYYVGDGPPVHPSKESLEHQSEWLRHYRSFHTLRGAIVYAFDAVRSDGLPESYEERSGARYPPRSPAAFGWTQVDAFSAMYGSEQPKTYILSIEPGGFAASVPVGGTASTTFRLENSGSGHLQLGIVSADVDWVSVTPASTVTLSPVQKEDVDVHLDATDLTVGVHEASVTTTFTPYGGGVPGQASFLIELQVTPGGVTVRLQPRNVTLPVNGTQSFTATVTGTTNTGVNWHASCGSISGTSNTITYTAPASADTCTVTATSAADHTARDTATVTVRDGTVTATRIVDVELDTSTPTTLDSGRWVRAAFTVETDAPDGFRVWLRPLVDGVPPHHGWGIQGSYLYSASPVVDGPVARIERGFAQAIGEHDLHVDGLWFYVVSPDHSEVLLDEVIPTSITYRSAASISEPAFTPASGAVEQGSTVGVRFDFTLERQRSVLVDLFPIASRYGDPCGWCDHVASITQTFTSTTSGRYDGGFTVLDTVTGEPTVDNLYIDIFDANLGIGDSWAIYTARRPVSFQFTNPSRPSATALTSQADAPSLPADVCLAQAGAHAGAQPDAHAGAEAPTDCDH